MIQIFLSMLVGFFNKVVGTLGNIDLSNIDLASLDPMFLLGLVGAGILVYVIVTKILKGIFYIATGIMLVGILYKGATLLMQF